MSEDLSGLKFRPHEEQDLPFLHDSWGSSYYAGNPAHRHLTPDEFHRFHRPIRVRFFGKPTTTVIVCCDAENPWHIVGWAGVEAIIRPAAANHELEAKFLVLQYLYVKSTFKRRGVASELIRRSLPTRPAAYTHLTDKVSRILAKRRSLHSEFIHVPHLV